MPLGVFLGVSGVPWELLGDLGGPLWAHFARPSLPLATNWVPFGRIWGDFGCPWGSGGSLLHVIGRQWEPWGRLFNVFFAEVVHVSLFPRRVVCFAFSLLSLLASVCFSLAAI